MNKFVKLSGIDINRKGFNFVIPNNATVDWFIKYVIKGNDEIFKTLIKEFNLVDMHTFQIKNLDNNKFVGISVNGVEVLVNFGKFPWILESRESLEHFENGIFLSNSILIRDDEQAKQIQERSEQLQQKTSILGKTFNGRITTSGPYIEVRLFDDNDEFRDKLYSLAQDYLIQKELNWQIQKPRSWFQGSGPHVTLTSDMIKYKNDILPVKLISIYHFEESSRWIVLHVEIPSKYKCSYGCHLSIGQQ